MRVQPRVFDDAESLGSAAASEIADAIAASAGRRFLLGCPGGRSPSSTYAALARETRERGLDLSRVVIVMMDDYVVTAASGEFVREDAAARHSCERFAREEILAPLNAAAIDGYAIADDNLWLPDVAAAEEYDDRIRAAGGIDLFILASGSSDGHVAFNAPGAGASSRTRLVELPDSTRRDNLATFPSFGGNLDNVPRHGITVGIDTIAANSRSVLLLAHGSDKGQAVARLVAAQGYEEDWPSTVLTECREPRFFIDRAAAAAASRHG